MSNPSDANSLRQAALAELASLTSIEFGTLAEVRPGCSGFKHQCWEDGRNRCTYIPAGQVAALRQDLENGKRFQQITAALATAAIQESRDRRAAAADTAEKKTSGPNASRKNTGKPKASSPKPARSSSTKKRAPKH